MKPVKLSDFELNKENPFAKQALVNIGNAIVSKSVKTANKDEAAVLKAVDNNGEILGNSVFIPANQSILKPSQNFLLMDLRHFLTSNQHQ